MTRPSFLRRGLVLAALGLVPALAVPAAADWLVLNDGTWVETRGTWEQKGRRVVFTSADGTLSSLKSDQVDLAASRSATASGPVAAEDSRVATEPPAPPPRLAKRRWTNADIPRGVVAQPSPATGPGGDKGAEEGTASDGEASVEAADPVPASTVVVDGWEQGEDVDGSAVILGRVLNSSDRVIAAAVRLEVILFDREGKHLAERTAPVVPSALPPGGSGEFRAEFPGIYDFSLVRFEIASTSLESGRGAPPRALGGGTASAIASEDDGAEP